MACTGASSSVISSMSLPALDLLQGRPLRLEGAALLDPQTVNLAVELLAERLEQLRLHEPRLEEVQDGVLERVGSDVQAVVAGSAVARGRAAEEVGTDLHVA